MPTITCLIQSCLITGITPQVAWERGVPSAFAARIEAEMAQPGTVGVGYNTIRFDDEITRFMFWRNLIDPLRAQWQNQCGRWDLLDVVRLACTRARAAWSGPPKRTARRASSWST